MKRSIGILALLVLLTFAGILITRLRATPSSGSQSGMQALSVVTTEKTPASPVFESPLPTPSPDNGNLFQPLAQRRVPDTPAALSVVRIDPSSLNVSVGESFSLNLQIETERQTRAFELVIRFNPSVVQVVNLVDGDFLSSTGAQVFVVPPKIDNKQGEVRFAAVSLGKVQGSDTRNQEPGVLGRVEVLAISVGAADFFLSHIGLVDEKLQLYSPISLVGSSVNVHLPQETAALPQSPTPYAPYATATPMFVPPSSPDPREVRLTEDGYESGPIWSPDGSKIVYRKFNNYPCIDCTVELWMMNADGSAQQKIAAHGYDPVFSPDGQMLLYVAPAQTGGQELRIAEVKKDQMGGPVVQEKQVVLAANTLRDAQWVANNQIAFVRDGFTVMLDLTTNNERTLNEIPLLTNEVRGSYHVAPNGSKIAYHQDSILHVADLTSSRVVTITEHLYPWTDSYAWSPDGQRLTYVAHPGGPLPELWIVGADGTGAELLASSRHEYFSEPTWSFDGKTIAFRRCPTGTNVATSCEIFLIDSNGANLRRLTENQLNERFLAWSPNGAMLAFTRESFDYMGEPLGQTLWTIRIEKSFQ